MLNAELYSSEKNFAIFGFVSPLDLKNSKRVLTAMMQLGLLITLLLRLNRDKLGKKLTTMH